MSKCFEKFVAEFPRDAVLDLQQAADAAFGEASSIARRFVELPERSNMLGQLRHARLEAGLRQVGADHGLKVSSPHTTPKGGRFSLVASDRIALIRGNVQYHRGPPRPTRFRKEMATLNSWLSPFQPDFYMSVPEPRADRLCAVFVVAAQRGGDETVPGWVGIGFPNHDLSGWHDLRSLGDILAMYHDADTKAHPQEDVQVVVPDLAVPKLKKGGA